VRKDICCLFPLDAGSRALNNFVLSLFVPIFLIVLIVHIITAIRWVHIKILSAVINNYGEHTLIVADGCYTNGIIITLSNMKIKVTVTHPYGC
jgi:hypothetical protein